MGIDQLLEVGYTIMRKEVVLSLVSENIVHIIVSYTYVSCSVQTWAWSTNIVRSGRSVGVSRIAVCWDFDTTLLATRYTVLGPGVGVRSSVWSSTLMDRVERAVGLASFDSACVPEEPRVDTRLARDPGVGDGRRSLEKYERKSMHCKEAILR